MGRKRREEFGLSSGNSEAVPNSVKRAKKDVGKDSRSEKVKKANNVVEKTKNVSTEKDGGSGNKKFEKQEVYSDTSSSSESENGKTPVKVEKKSVSESNSDSDSDSSESDSSPTSREGGEKDKDKARAAANQKNSVTNLMPLKSYVPPPKSSSSDSYHSDTEEEDKKRRKKQKKLLQMQLTKKVKKGLLTRDLEKEEEVQSDLDEDGGDNVASNSDEVPVWPEGDYAELIRRIEAQIPAKDNQKFDSRAAKLHWGKIAFAGYTPDECMEVWLAISKRIRRFRTLHEILQDAKDWITKPWTNFYRGSKKNRHPDMPPRPLSTYMLYYLDHKDKVAKENPGMEMTQVSKIISELYKNLSSGEREKYSELAAKQRQNFDTKLSEFYKEHPEIAQQQQQRKIQAKELATKGPKKASNPFKLFFQEQVKIYGDAAVDKKAIEEEAKEKWKNLSDKKKLVWIDWALEDAKRYEDEMKVYKLEHPDYVPPNSYKSVLNKDERNIKERLAGKPVKPPNSAYSFFSRLMLQSDPVVKSIPPKERMAEVSKKWKEISDAQKSHYEEKVKQLQDVYKLEFASYLEGLTPEEREKELKKITPKRKSLKVEEKAKKKALKKNSAVSRKSSSKNKDEDCLKLYKGEPKPPPVKVFEVFYQSFISDKSRGGSESEKMKDALKHWNGLSEAKKDSYRRKHEELKQKYIEDFEIFLKGLSPDELKEFSVMKELAKKTKEAKEQRELINGNNGDSNEDSDDEDNGSSSDSDSEDSDSGKSSKSSSSSEDSE